MVKKTVIAIVAVVLLVAVFASASYRYGGYLPSRYVYAPQSPYLPQTVNPYFATNYPTYNYPYYYPYAPYTYPSYIYPYYYYGSGTLPSYSYPYYALTADKAVRTGRPSETYPTYVGVKPRGQKGQLCGKVGVGEFDCDYGLTCDFTATPQPDVGICLPPRA